MTDRDLLAIIAAIIRAGQLAGGDIDSSRATQVARKLLDWADKKVLEERPGVERNEQSVPG